MLLRFEMDTSLNPIEDTRYSVIDAHFVHGIAGDNADEKLLSI